MGHLDKLIFCQKLKIVAQSPINHPIWSHWAWVMPLTLLTEASYGNNDDYNLRQHLQDQAQFLKKTLYKKFVIKMGQSLPLFCPFSSFPHDRNQYKLIKCRWCAWDSNLEQQFRRCRRIHWAMAAPHYKLSFIPKCLTHNQRIENLVHHHRKKRQKQSLK